MSYAISWIVHTFLFMLFYCFGGYAIITTGLKIALLYYALFYSSLFPVLCVLLGILTFFLNMPKIARFIMKSNTHPIGKEIIILALKLLH